MVISLTNQLKVSQGDYARTIESASNQIRIMKEQWDRLSRAVGNVFYPILQKILPYINGVLMALTEIFNLLASLLGFEMPEFDYSGLSVTSDAALDLMDNLDGAGESADKLASKMKGLRGFDKLNVINTPSSGGGGSVSGGGGSFVDPKIMDAFNKTFEQYNDLMDSVRMKALDIRDAIMEWLGFTKKINPLTGEISWEYEGIGKTLSNMWQSFKKLNPLAKLFVAYGVWKAIKNIWTWGTKAANVLGIGGLGKSIKNVLIDNIHILNDEAADTASNMDRLKTAVVGIGFGVAGINLLKDSLERADREGKSLATTLEGAAGYLSTIGGFALSGSAFGPWGAAAGSAIGAVISMITILTQEHKNYVDYFLEDSAKALEDFSNSFAEEMKNIQKNAEFDMTKITITEQLIDELDRITDANGRVKAGYEDRAKFIINDLNKAYGLEIQMIDGVIQKYPEEINNLKKVIELKKAEIYLNLAEEQYTASLKRRAEAERILSNIEVERQLVMQDSTKSEKEKMELFAEIDEREKKAKNDLLLIEKAKVNYENMSTAILTENTNDIKANTKAIDQYFKDLDAATNESNENLYETSYITWRKIGADLANNFDVMVEATGKSFNEMNEQEQAAYTQMFDDLTDTTAKMLGEVGELQIGMGTKWQAIGDTSTEAFLAALDKIPADLRQLAIDKIYPQGKGMSEELQRGINEKFPELVVKPKLEMPTNIYQYAQNLASKVSGWFNVTPNKTAATGGIFVNGKWQDVAQYASGTVNAPVGQMFVARERGPELVGTIGGHTAVMNNDQIVSSVASGVYQAVKSATSQQTSSQPQVFNIYLDKNNKIATYMLDKFDDMAKSNGKPIEIGG